MKSTDERGPVAVAAITVVAVALGGFALVSLVRALDSGPCDDVRFRTTSAPDKEFTGAPPPIANDRTTRLLRSAFRGGSSAVYCNDFPDPYVLVSGGNYYAYSTNTFGYHVPVLTSGGLFDNGARKEALPSVASWAAEDTVWAPSVAEIDDDSFVMYYSTRPVDAERKCLSVATSDSPDGEYVDSTTEPLVCGAIDASPVLAPDGTRYLVWSHDNAGELKVARLSEDGLSLQGEHRTLIRANQGWEGGKIEAPSMVEEGGTYYLFYSGNWWDTASYAIGYATCSAPMGPCTKASGPWLASSERAQGPGGEELFRDGAGNIWMALHAWVDGKVGYTQGARNLFVLKIAFVNGAPVPG